jgi:hypothetical protein
VRRSAVPAVRAPLSTSPKLAASRGCARPSMALMYSASRPSSCVPRLVGWRPDRPVSA